MYYYKICPAVIAPDPGREGRERVILAETEKKATLTAGNISNIAIVVKKNFKMTASEILTEKLLPLLDYLDSLINLP